MHYGILTMEMVLMKIKTGLQNEIKCLFKNMVGLRKRKTNLFFADIDSLKQKMLEEIVGEI